MVNSWCTFKRLPGCSRCVLFEDNSANVGVDQTRYFFFLVKNISKGKPLSALEGFLHIIVRQLQIVLILKYQRVCSPLLLTHSLLS